MEELRDAIEADLIKFIDDLVEKTEKRRETMRRINEMLRPGLREAYRELHRHIYEDSFCTISSSMHGEGQEHRRDS